MSRKLEGHLRVPGVPTLLRRGSRCQEPSGKNQVSGHRAWQIEQQRCDPLLGRIRFGVLSYVLAYFWP